MTSGYYISTKKLAAFLLDYIHFLGYHDCLTNLFLIYYFYLVALKLQHEDYHFHVAILVHTTSISFPDS